METTTLKQIKQLAGEWRDLFEYNPRPDSPGYYSFKMTVIRENLDSYNTLSDLIHNSNTDEDSTYRWVNEALEACADIDADNEDALDEVLDRLEPDIYTDELTTWLDRSTNNIEYLTEAVNEYGAVESGTALLQMAQTIAMREVYQNVLEGLHGAVK